MANQSKPNDKTKKTETLPDKDEKQAGKPKKKAGRIFKIILIILILLIIAATSFAVGIYLKFIDVQALGQKWKLNEYPVVGQYFSEPKTNFEPVELESQSSSVMSQNPNIAAVTTTTGMPLMVQPEAMLPEKRIIDDAELQKQAKIKQQEEAKRISKLARLYSAMAPEEAVAILNKMDDETVLVILSKMEDEQVAKIMALFDARHAAVLSQSMLRGRTIN